MLALIGIGLDTGDISAKSLNFIKKSNLVLADRFTSIMSQEGIDFIENESGKKIKKLSRSDLEENIRSTISPAKGSDVSILVIGDPLIATTHHIILDEARLLGITCEVFHSSSIFSAGIGESGLDIYRFGPTTTVPFWSEHYKPRSFIDVISRNLSNSEHTLLLLDIDQANISQMGIRQAVAIIKGADNDKVIKGGKKVMVLADIGRKTQSIIYTEFSNLDSAGEETEGKTLSIIIPADLNFAEEESVKRFGR